MNIISYESIQSYEIIFKTLQFPGEWHSFKYDDLIKALEFEAIRYQPA